MERIEQEKIDLFNIFASTLMDHTFTALVVLILFYLILLALLTVDSFIFNF